MVLRVALALFGWALPKSAPILPVTRRRRNRNRDLNKTTKDKDKKAWSDTLAMRFTKIGFGERFPLYVI